MNKQLLGRGAAYIYIQFIVSAISGYVFWMILSHITNSAVIGTLSTVISISEILTSVAIIGIPDSIQRFLGKTFAEQKIGDSIVFVEASLFLISLGIIVSTLLVLTVGSFFGLFENDPNLRSVLVLVIISSAIRTLLNSIVISSLRTRVLPTVNIVSSSIKIILSIILAMGGSGVVDLAISYLFVGELLSSILLGSVTIKLLRSVTKRDTYRKISFIRACKDILTGGVAIWIPLMLMTLGYQLGTIVLFGSKGSSDTAIYFITFNLVSIILLGTTSLTTIALPALSAIRDGRKRLAWQTIRWGYLISIPLSSCLIFYSQEILRLFGENYTAGELSLQILLLSILPSIIANGISTLVYSYGNYKQSLAIELVMNFPRVVLYFILIPIYGPTGGAISFTTGSLLAFVISIIIAHKIRMLISWKDLAFVLIIPILIGYFLHSLQVSYVIGIPITIFISYISLLKLNTITRSDIQDVIDIFPPGISSRMLRLLQKLKRN